MSDVTEFAFDDASQKLIDRPFEKVPAGQAGERGAAAA